MVKKSSQHTSGGNGCLCFYIYIYIYIFSSPGSSAAAQRCMFGWPFWMLRGPDFGPVDEPSVRRFAWEPSCQNYMQPHLCAVAPDPN